MIPAPRRAVRSVPRRARRVTAARWARRVPGVRPPAADATREPRPGPAPEAVFDRVTGPLGPYLRRIARLPPARPGAGACDEDP
jgi:hypothetical protein